MFAQQQNRLTPTLPYAQINFFETLRKTNASVCLVTNSSIEVAQCDLARTLLTEAGVLFTQLDLAGTAKPDAIHLRSIYTPSHWYLPIQALCAYHWLRDNPHDIIIFSDDFGAGFYCCQAKRQGIAFANMHLVTFANHMHMRHMEAERRLPTAPRTDFEIDFLERETARLSDMLIFPRKEIADWTTQAEWTLPAAECVFIHQAEAEAKSLPKAKADKPEIHANISIILPCYNRAAMLQEAIESVLAQSYATLELIVVDDGSTEAGIAKLQQYYASIFEKKKWIWLRQENAGPAAARMTGAAQAQGNYLFFLDDDNALLPDFMALLARAAKHSNADIITCQLGAHPDNKHKPLCHFPSRFNSHENIALHKAFIGGNLLLNAYCNTVGETSSLYKRAVFENLGGFKGDRAMLFEDWELLTRAMLSNADIQTLPEIGILYRAHEGGRHLHGATWFESQLKSLQPLWESLPPALRPLLLAARAESANGHSAKAPLPKGN